MSERENPVPFLLAAVVAAMPVVAILWLILTPQPYSEDTTLAPKWLKDLCRADNEPCRHWTEIVIHHSAGDQGDLRLIDRYHRDKRGWLSAGYHFIIGNGTLSGNGVIEVCPRWLDQQDGSHCHGHNATAIGICLIGNFEVPGEKPSPVQLLSLAQLTAYLSLRYGIPSENIYLHREVEGALTLCPGKNFPEREFFALEEAIADDYASR
jgi:hypothetical protein